MNDKSKYYEKRIYSIDIFRYICALLVVSVHTHPFSELGEEFGYFFSQILPRIAVPFFFAASGYFFITKKVFLKTYIKRNLITYSSWSLVYYTITFLKYCTSDYSQREDLLPFLFSCIVDFFITGSYYHFWFFPALIFSAIITTLLFKVCGKKATIYISLIMYFFGCIGCAYGNLAANIPLLGTFFKSHYFTVARRIFFMGFPFFVSGYVAEILLEKTKELKNFIKISVYTSAFLWIAEIWLVIKMNWHINITITFGLYGFLVAVFNLLLSKPLKSHMNIGKICKDLANFTYYTHPLFLLFFSKIWKIIFGRSITGTPAMVCTILTTVLCVMIIHKTNSKFSKRLLV